VGSLRVWRFWIPLSAWRETGSTVGSEGRSPPVSKARWAAREGSKCIGVLIRHAHAQAARAWELLLHAEGPAWLWGRGARLTVGSVACVMMWGA
jgi:hypothetical protein